MEKNDIILTEDYHTHTFYSDGKSTMEQNVIFAIKAGLKTVGISDHGYGHFGFGVKYYLYDKMKEEVIRLGEKYPEIKILLGVEANILDDSGNIDVDDYILSRIDYVLAGYHFGSEITKGRQLLNHVRNLVKPLNEYEREYNTRALVNAMEKNDIFILTHPGDKGLIDTLQVAETALKTNTILEINAHHQNLSVNQINLIKDMDLKFALGSDAHRYYNVGNVDKAIDAVIESGLDINKIINVRKNEN